MNLFCFSLEGSMDSLYERVQESHDPKENLCRGNNHSFNTYVQFIPPDRSLSFELSECDHTEVKKRWKKSMIQKSMSENEAFERKQKNAIIGQDSKKTKNEPNRKPSGPEDLSEDPAPIGHMIHSKSGKKTEDTSSQMAAYNPWVPPRVQSPVNNEQVTESDGNKSESMGTLQRIKKLVQAKKAPGASGDDVKNGLISTSYSHDTEEDEEEETMTTCMKLTKSQEKKTCKENTVKKQETGSSVTYSSASLDRLHPTRRKNPAVVSLNTDSELWSEWKSFPVTQLYPFEFAVPKIEVWEKCTCCNHQPWFPTSFTDIDISYAWSAEKKLLQCNNHQGDCVVSHTTKWLQPGKKIKHLKAVLLDSSKNYDKENCIHVTKNI